MSAIFDDRWPNSIPLPSTLPRSRGGDTNSLVVWETTFQPARKVASTTSHHIAPPQTRQLLGRDDAIRQISEQLNQPGYLTIVGPGGAGKTSLAVMVAHQSCKAGEAIAFADLSTVSDPRFVVPAIASALGVSLGFDDPIAGVIDLLRSNRLLLIIDNCEHVIAMAATVVERISSEAPAARIIAT